MLQPKLPNVRSLLSGKTSKMSIFLGALRAMPNFFLISHQSLGYVCVSCSVMPKSF